MFLNLFNPVFDNEEGKAAEGKAAEGKTEEGKGVEKKTFTQEEVNTFLANEKRKTQATYEKRIAQLETLRDNANLTQQQVEELNTQIADMQAEHKTKEQLHTEKQTKLERDYQAKLKIAEEAATGWQGRYTGMVINNAIISASVVNEAFDPDQILAILQPNTRLVEVKEEGKKTGTFEARVKFNAVDETGKPVELDITPEEAVKRMTAMDKFANLFKTNLKGGMGDFKVNGKSSAVGDLKNTGNYLAQRKAGKLPTSKKG